MFWIYLIPPQKWMKKFFNEIFYIEVSHDLFVITFRMHQTFSSLPFNYVKFIFVVRWIFYLLSFLRSSITSRRYGLMFSRDSFIVSCSLPSLPLDSIYLSLKVPAIFFSLNALGMLRVFFWFCARCGCTFFRSCNRFKCWFRWIRSYEYAF